MRNLWIRIGCFLLGYNYEIVKRTSEASIKSVIKYLSALLIVGTLWGFIGFVFTHRYLGGSTFVSIIGALVMVIMVIQIERQIILTIGKNRLAIGFRIAIGFVMAIIGSVILDQIMFKDDVEINKIESVQNKVSKLLPVKTQELTYQIKQLDSSIIVKEAERAAIIEELGHKPMIITPSTVVESKKDTLTGKMITTNKIVTTQSMPNPKASLIPQIDVQLKTLRDQKSGKEEDKLNIQEVLEKDYKSKVGFLDELKLLFDILLDSGIALVVWLLFFVFFLSIELFVLVNKWGDRGTDYDKTIVYQMDIRNKMLDKLQEDKTDIVKD